jgi:hypothetical protein
VSPDFPNLLCDALDRRVEAQTPGREELPSRARYKELLDILESKLPYQHSREALVRLRRIVGDCPE